MKEVDRQIRMLFYDRFPHYEYMHDRKNLCFLEVRNFLFNRIIKQSPDGFFSLNKSLGWPGRTQRVNLPVCKGQIQCFIGTFSFRLKVMNQRAIVSSNFLCCPSMIPMMNRGDIPGQLAR